MQIAVARSVKMTKFSQNSVSSDNTNCSKGVVPITMY